MEKQEISTFQVLIPQEDYTCGVLMIIFLLFSGIIFSHRSGLESNYPHLVYSITFVLLLPNCHTNQLYLRYHEYTTVTFLALFPRTWDEASCVRSDPENCGKINLLKYFLVLSRMDFRSYFTSLLEEADFFKLVPKSLRGHVKVPYEKTRCSGPP